jgi:peptidoglycan/LPS O-acetylase OafA/YrhL
VLRALRELALVLGFVLAVTFAVALLYQHLGGESAHRAFAIVFYIAGAGMLVFALTPRGARGRGYGTMPLLRRYGGNEPAPALNPTGLLAVVGIVLLALAVVFDTFL